MVEVELISEEDGCRIRKGQVKSPYHLKPIYKGILGQISKIQEELDELKDAEQQGIKIMINIELSDLYGAIESYVETQGLTMEDLKKFSDLTKKVKKQNNLAF